MDETKEVPRAPSSPCCLKPWIAEATHTVICATGCSCFPAFCAKCKCFSLLGGMDTWLARFPSGHRLSFRQMGHASVCAHSLIRSVGPRCPISSESNWKTSRISKLRAPVRIHPILVPRPPGWAMCPQPGLCKFCPCQQRRRQCIRCIEF